MNNESNAGLLGGSTERYRQATMAHTYDVESSITYYIGMDTCICIPHSSKWKWNKKNNMVVLVIRDAPNLPSNRKWQNAVLVPFFKWCNRSLRASGTPQIVMQVSKTNLRHINVVYAVTSCFINTYKECCVYSAVCWCTSKRVYRLNSKCCIIECAMYMCAQTLQSVYCVCTTTV